MMNDDFMDLLQEAMDFSSSEPENKEEAPEITEDMAKEFSNEKLCSIIATNRYLKMERDLELLCMRELIRRRADGDSFAFEDQIKSYYNSFVPIEKGIPEISQFFKNFSI